MIDLQIGDVTLCAAAPLEETATLNGVRSLLVEGRLKIVEQVELHEIYQTGGNFICNSVVIEVGEFVVGRRRLDLVLSAIEYNTCRGCDAGSVVCLRHCGINCLQSHLVVERSDNKFSNRNFSTMREERPHA